MAKTQKMIRHKKTIIEKQTNDTYLCSLVMRNIKKTNAMRKVMWWASCYKWDMAMYNKQLKLK